MLCSTSFFALCLLVLGPPLVTASTTSKPNVVFILIDDTGYNDLGYNNRSEHSPGRILTPNLDRLADSGVKLDNYYVQPICSPTRGALMTGRYTFRYGLGGTVISPGAPWSMPANETFLPQYLKDAGYRTALFGKWHLGLFKNDSLPMARGFDEQSGLYNGAGDHYEHLYLRDPNAYDWHVNQTFSKEAIGRYSGDLVRDDAVDFITRQASRGEGAAPFFLYLPFQEAHEPYQVDQKYKDMYPHLASMPETQALAGMITHTDAMVGDIVRALKSTGLYEKTIIIFSSDNGGPGGQDHLTPGPHKPFDPAYIDRNYPFRGQKWDIYEGGIRVPGFIHSPLLPDQVRGTTVHDIVHVTDWLPTIVAATGSRLDSREHLPLDGLDMWGCITGKAPCQRKEVLLNIDPECDLGGMKGPGLPPPKAALRLGEMKIMAECFDTRSLSFRGHMFLYNLTSDPGETTNLAFSHPAMMSLLQSKLLAYGKEAAMVPPLQTKLPPWQGEGYYCANCTIGKPSKLPGSSGTGITHIWEPWCQGKAGVTC